MKMKSALTLQQRLRQCAFALLILCVSSKAFAVVHFRQALGNDQERAAFLLYVQKHIPWLLTKAQTAHTVPFYEALKADDDLTSFIRALPEFQRMDANRPELTALTVEKFATRTSILHSERGETASEISAKAEALARTIEVTPPQTLAGEASILAAREIEYLLSRDPRAVLTGLINCLPQASRAAFFQLEPEQQLAALRESTELTDSAVQSQFKGERFGLAPAGLSRESLLEFAEQLFAREAHLSSLLVLANEGSLSIFRPNAEGVTALSQLATRILADPVLQKRAQRYLGRFARSQGRQAFQTETREERVVSEKLHLIEVPPYVAIFRGFIGGDCSTKYSLPYPYAPLERLYFIYDSENTLRGYAQGTLIELEGRRTLYVHDISGRNLSAAQADLALNGIYKLLSRIGVEHMALPTETLFSSLNHFDELKALLKKYQAKTEAIDTTYLDGDLRKKIKEKLANFFDYDSAERNKKAHLFVPDEQLQSSLSAKMFTLRYMAPQLAGISRGEGLILALDLETGARSDDAAVTTTAFGIEAPEWEEAKKIYLNASKLPIAEYIGSVKALYERLGVAWRDAIPHEKVSFFRVGLARAPDLATSSTPQQKRAVIDLVIELMTKSDSNLPLKELISASPEFFTHNERLQRAFRTKWASSLWGTESLLEMIESGFTPAWTPEDEKSLLAGLDSVSSSTNAIAAKAFLQITPNEEALVKLAKLAGSDTAGLRKTAFAILVANRSSHNNVNWALLTSAGDASKFTPQERLAAIRALIDNGRAGPGTKQLLGEIRQAFRKAELKDWSEFVQVAQSLTARLRHNPCMEALSAPPRPVEHNPWFDDADFYGW